MCVRVCVCVRARAYHCDDCSTFHDILHLSKLGIPRLSEFEFERQSEKILYLGQRVHMSVYYVTVCFSHGDPRSSLGNIY